LFVWYGVSVVEVMLLVLGTADLNINTAEREKSVCNLISYAGVW
jgi:hypothetical protein